MKTPEIKAYKQNTLFRSDEEHWYFNACVGKNGGPYSEKAYALGYFKASERLYNSIMDDRTSLDLLVYPLVFNLRHGVELYLKHLVNRIPWLWKDVVTAQPTHKLLDNWELLKKYLQMEASFAPTETIPTVDAILTDFIAIDASGEAFRFPSSRSGFLFLQDTAHVNVVVFAETMKTLHDVFEFWSDTFEQLWDVKGEEYLKAQESGETLDS